MNGVLNDAKYNKLGTLGYTGSIDDRFLAFIQATTSSRTAKERDLWLFLYPTGVGSLNDIKRDYFKSLGFAFEDINDLELAYWLAP